MLKNRLAKRVLPVCAAVFILLFSGGCSKALNDFYVNAGLRNYDKRDYKQAYKYFKAAADHGDGRGQFLTGEMYRTGEGVEKDLITMLVYFEKAAGNPNTPEELLQIVKGKLGILYLSEKSIQNAAKGVKYLTEAANMKEGLQYQIYLGAYYYEGVGVKKDYNKAFELISKAAGTKIEAGTDKEKEKELIGLRGQARYLLGDMYVEGHGAAMDYKKAFDCYQTAAEDGSSDAECMLGFMYVIGEGTAKDRNKGMQILEGLAAKGSVKAKEILAEIEKNKY